MQSGGDRFCFTIWLLSYSLGKFKSFDYLIAKVTTESYYSSGTKHSQKVMYPASFLIEFAFVPQGQGLGFIQWCPAQYIYTVVVQQMIVDKNHMITHCLPEYTIHVPQCWHFYIWLGLLFFKIFGGWFSVRWSLYSHSKIYYTSCTHTLPAHCKIHIVTKWGLCFFRK